MTEVATITRAKYKSQRGHDYAGTISALEPETVEHWKQAYPTWLGKHWHLTSTPTGGPTIAPVNVHG